jgi:hypothetical protein
LSAVLVWLRASERISVRVLGIAGFRRVRFGTGIFARRGIGMVHGEILGPCHRAKCDGGKVCQPGFAVRAYELDDLCTHEKASHTAIVTRPAKESDIKYAVMLLAFLAIVLTWREAKRRSDPVFSDRNWIASRTLVMRRAFARPIGSQ